MIKNVTTNDEHSASGSGSCISEPIQAIIPKNENFESECRQVSK